jgi:hypothetical protein
MEMHAQAVRQATREVEGGKLAADQLETRVGDLLANPTDEMKLAGAAKAEEVSFTRQPGRDESVYKLMKAAQGVPVIGRVVMPFTRTPYELGRYHFQRTPIGLVTKSFQADLAAGGAKADLAYARVTAGTAILLSMTDLAMKGEITGAMPSSPRARAQLPPGWKPYSFKIGDTYYSYRGLEPVASAISLSADLVSVLAQEGAREGDATNEELAMGVVFALAEQLIAAPFMSGVQRFFQAMGDKEQYGQNYVQSLAASVVPTGVGVVAHAMDPIGRVVASSLDAAQSRLPYFSKLLPAAFDNLGRELPFASGKGATFDVLSPIRASKDRSEPIDEELVKIDSVIYRPGKNMNFDGVKVNMDMYPQEYSRFLYLQGSGKLQIPGMRKPFADGMSLRETLNALVTGKHASSDIYSKLTDGDDGTKAKMIAAYVEAFRAVAKQQVLSESPGLRAHVDDKKRDKLSEALGQQMRQQP